MIDNMDIERNGFPWANIDTISPKSFARSKVVIMNTDWHSGPGVHWVTIAKLSDGTYYLIDPLGPKNKRVINTGEQIVDEMLADNLGEVDVWPHAIQQTSDVLCGYYSILNAAIARKYLAQNPKASGDRLGREIDRHWDVLRPTATNNMGDGNHDVLAEAFGK